MKVCKRLADGNSDDDRFRIRNKSLAIDTLPQVLPFDKIHHQVLSLPIDHEVIGHSWQIRMAQISKDHRFAPKLASILFGSE